jgi:hypothetical protein
VPRALFVCYGGGHAKMMIPVVRELSRDGRWEPIVLGLTLAGPQMRAAGIAAFGYRDLIRPDDRDAEAHGHTLLDDSHDPSSGIALEESVAYLGLSYQDLVDRLGAAAAADRYREHGRHAFLQLGPMRRAIERWRPDVVVTTNSPKSERAALVAAREAGLPTVAIEDLLGIRQVVIRDFVPPFRADRLCVSTSIAIENLERDEGADRASCRLTGNPSFDRLATVADRRDDARARLGIGSGTRLAVFYTQSGPDLDTVSALVAGVAQLPGLRVGIRRHPNHRRSAPDQVRAGLPARVALFDDEDLDDLLAAEDVAVSVSTTVMVEAILSDNVVVQLGPPLALSRPPGEHIDDLPLYRYGATVLASDAQTVQDIVSGAQRVGQDERVRARELFVRPGGAAAAVADQIREVAPAG